MRFTLTFLLLICSIAVQAQTVTGTWRTVDDETGKAKSILEVYESNGKLYGKVTQLLLKPSNTVCEKCTGDKKNQLIVGMIVLENMIMKDGFWQGGRILDPEKGRWYGCRVWLKEGDPNTLVVRGSLGPFYRTQYWQRVK
jgi:uncharacterized protein (DUF2147 family)